MLTPFEVIDSRTVKELAADWKVSPQIHSQLFSVCKLTCPVCYSQWNDTICIDMLVPLEHCKGAAVFVQLDWVSMHMSVGMSAYGVLADRRALPFSLPITQGNPWLTYFFSSLLNIKQELTPTHEGIFTWTASRERVAMWQNNCNYHHY